MSFFATRRPSPTRLQADRPRSVPLCTRTVMESIGLVRHVRGTHVGKAEEIVSSVTFFFKLKLVQSANLLLSLCTLFSLVSHGASPLLRCSLRRGPHGHRVVGDVFKKEWCHYVGPEQL